MYSVIKNKVRQFLGEVHDLSKTWQMVGSTVEPIIDKYINDFHKKFHMEGFPKFVHIIIKDEIYICSMCSHISSSQGSSRNQTKYWSTMYE